MITSTSNAKIKRLVQLKKKRKARDEEGVFLVEGIRMFRETPAERLAEVYVSQSFYERELKTAGQMHAAGSVRPEVLSDSVFSYVSDTKTPQGVLCVVRQMDYTLGDVTGGSAPHLLILDNLQDPGNLGTIMRAAEGAGVTGILMSSGCVDMYNPKVIRSTMGSVYRVPFYSAPDLADAIAKVKEKGIVAYAAHLEGSRDYDKEDYRKPCAFFIGNEGSGLRREIAAAADHYIKIPMCGQVESLNAAVASAVLMFEVQRQRRKDNQ